MRRKQWCLSAYDKDAAAQLAENGGLDPFLALLLTARGITDEIEAEAFLSPDLERSDPFTLIDMEKAVDRIASAVENFERIAVFGDYDADGVTSTALLYSYLVSQGANVEYRIPDR
ncbi:MAG: DHH family phosphoesterase, partial [Candidatus Fimenecus sp.]